VPLFTDPAVGAAGAAATWRATLTVAATALAYGLAGLLALLLAIPPGYAAPLYPAAGIGLAAALVGGRAAWLGVGLGALVVNGLLSARQGAGSPLLLAVPPVVALGAMLQAAIGAWLVQRRVRGPVTLAEPRQVAVFCLLAGPVACLLNASLATLVMSAAGLLAPGMRAFTWWTWWAGDTLGVLIAAPITLTLVGRPRADWAPRRITVGLPLLGTTLLLALATVLVARWDGQRSQTLFERDAAATAQALDERLRRALYALEAMHGLFIASDEVSADEMQRAAAPWLNAGLQVQALGYAERVGRDAVGPYQARVQQQDGRPYQVFDRPGPVGLTAQDRDKLVIRFLAPVASNATASGVNILSVPAARSAALRAITSDAAAATQGFKLTQEPSDQTGVVIYRALYSDSSGTDRTSWRGAVFVTLRMEQSVAMAMANAPDYLHWCLQDTDAHTDRPRLAGAAGCEHQAATDLVHQQAISFAGRSWRLVVSAARADVPDAGHGNAWLFSTVGLLSAAMLAALLLTVTGRARRIEVAVAERTTDLQREVAERQRTEAALRDSEQRLRNIVDHAPIGIAYADLQGRVHECNPRLRELLGDDQVQAMALDPRPATRSLVDWAPAADRAAEQQALNQLFTGAVSELRRRTRLQHRDGHLLWVQMGCRVLRDPQGEPKRLLVVVEDITDQLKRQEAEQGLQVAESASRAKNEFLSRMSHELRTPLNAILGFGQLLEMNRKPALAAHQAGWVGHILQAGWHLLEMINDTLDLSRIESGMLRLEPGPVALAPLVAGCLGMVQPAADLRQITLHQDLAADAASAWGDATRLKQVVTNLLSNAVKYNVHAGQVRLSTRRLDKQWLELRVTDTGLGLSPAQMAGLFQPFNRLGRERGHIEGTGIGLVISRRLAEMMGGTLEADSTQGQGASFVLRLPAAAPAATSDNQLPAPPETNQRYRQRQVHYIEDNGTNAEVMQGIMAQRPQVRMTVSTNGRDGLAALRRQPPDLLLLDLHLPDMDGLALLRQLKRDPQLHELPVLVVSADGTPAHVDEVLDAGAMHYLTKPLNVGAFLSLVDQVLEDVDTQYGELDGHPAGP
jgi:PAS domain S-box-containing protein